MKSLNFKQFLWFFDFPGETVMLRLPPSPLLLPLLPLSPCRDRIVDGNEESAEEPNSVVNNKASVTRSLLKEHGCYSCNKKAMMMMMMFPKFVFSLRFFTPPWQLLSLARRRHRAEACTIQAVAPRSPRGGCGIQEMPTRREMRRTCKRF